MPARIVEVSEPEAEAARTLAVLTGLGQVQAELASMRASAADPSP